MRHFYFAEFFSFGFVWIHSDEREVLLYFGYVKHNLAVLSAFANIMRVMNNTELWDTELTWYSLAQLAAVVEYTDCFSAEG